MPLFSLAIGVVKVNKQKHFASDIPPGDYSGIAHLGGNQYALVSDKSPTDGFFVFTINIDSVSGQVVSVVNNGFRDAHQPNRDQEGIAYVPQWGTLFVSGEADNKVKEYTTDGQLTGRQLAVPREMTASAANYGLEALTYNAATHRFWTTTESTLPADGTPATPQNRVRNKLRLQSFDDRLNPAEQYLYEMDEPTARRTPAHYAMGVSEMVATDDGHLLVLEREFYVSKKKLGSFVNCKLYDVMPQGDTTKPLEKKLLARIHTRFDLVHYGLANYEGMCLGPATTDGRRVLIMVSDSQSRYGGVLKDWFKTIVLDL